MFSNFQSWSLKLFINSGTWAGDNKISDWYFLLIWRFRYSLRLNIIWQTIFLPLARLNSSFSDFCDYSQSCSLKLLKNSGTWAGVNSISDWRFLLIWWFRYSLQMNGIWQTWQTICLFQTPEFNSRWFLWLFSKLLIEITQKFWDMGRSQQYFRLMLSTDMTI